MKSLLITGAASGIGAAVAHKFADEGWQIYAIDICEIPCYKNTVGYKADITNEGEISAIASLLGEQGAALDLIINVAGIHRMASLVESDYAVMKKLIEVNLTGTMLVNRCFHSLLAPRGRIVIVTSEVAYLDPMPFNGLYSVSKTALECYAQALRQELNLLGQRVITVRPGAIETPLCSESVDATARLARETELYKKQAGRFSGIAAKFIGKPMKPSALAKTVYLAATSKRPRAVYKKHRNPGLVLLNLLPIKMQCAIIKMLLNI